MAALTDAWATHEAAFDAALRLEGVGYVPEVEAMPDGRYRVRIIDNSGHVELVYNDTQAQDAIAYMEEEGEAIAEGYGSRRDMAWALAHPIRINI